MNYIFDQLNHQIDDIISYYNISKNSALQLISVVINYIIGDTRQTIGIKEDIYKIILVLKNHLKHDPALKMSLYNSDEIMKQNDLTLKELDIHFKCKIELEDLRAKIKNRESKLTETTCSYLKDLQGLREQLYRQSNNLSNDFQDQRHFDSFEITDPKYRDLLNTKINNLRQDYESKIKYLTQIAESQKKEIGTLKTQVQEFQFRAEYYDDTEYLIRKLFHLERDPYELWRLIQDNQGNSYFFQVFQNQKKGYGIDYQEIDQLIMAVRVQDRQFDQYKQTLDQQVAHFMDRILQDVYDLRQKIIEKESEIETLQKKYVRNLFIINRTILGNANRVISCYNVMLLKMAINLWKQKEQLKMSEVLKDLAQFQLKTIETDLFDCFIEQIHEQQDKIVFLELKLNGQKFLVKSLETKYSIIQHTLQQVKNHFNIKTLDLELEQKLLKMDNFQVRFCEELFNQLMFQKLTYTKYLQQISKMDKQIQTDSIELVVQLSQTKEIIIDNVKLTSFIKQKYAEKKEKLMLQSGNYNQNRSLSMQSQTDQLPQIKLQQQQQKKSPTNQMKDSNKFKYNNIDQPNQMSNNTSRILKQSESVEKKKIKFKTDAQVNVQTSRINPSSLSFDQDNNNNQIKPLFNNIDDIQFEQFDSNLLIQNQTNLLPQIQGHKEIKKNIIKQIKQIHNQVQYESEPEKQKKEEKRNKRKLKNNIIIQYEDYPKYEEQNSFYLFIDKTKKEKGQRNKNNKLTQFIYKM